MRITIIDSSDNQLRAADLDPGDVVVRDANKSRGLKNRVAYLVLYKHSRFHNIQQYQSTSRDVIVVNLNTSRLDSFDNDQPVLKLDTSDIRLPVLPREKQK